MTQHVFYDHHCSKCYEAFLPLEEDGKKCPKCGLVADKENPPTVAKIVEVAYTNLRQPFMRGPFVGDSYMVNAFGVIQGLLEEEHLPVSDEEIDHLTKRIVMGMDFPNCPHLRDHASTFIKAVITEFIKNDAYSKEKTG